MILARPISATRADDLELAFRRMALPLTAREYLQDKLPAFTLLLTGLERPHGRLLRACAEAQDAPGREEFPTFVAGDQRHRPGSALLLGRLEQLQRLADRARAEGHPELAQAIEVAVCPRGPTQLVLGERTLTLGERTFVMGILNVTPDSFSDGGRYLHHDAAIRQAEAMVSAGVDLLDVGGESTRPGALPVPVEEELARVIPLIERLRARFPVPISVDTRKAEVAETAIAVGASLVNDVSALTFDPRMAEVIARRQVACCLMHLQGRPETMQQAPRYDDVVAEIVEALAGRVDQAVAAGIPRERVLVDPGIGFGKTFGHNLYLLRRLIELRAVGAGVLVGPSRKAFLGGLTGKPAPERVLATAVTVAIAAVLGGADIVRVHDVPEAIEALKVAHAVRHAQEAGALFGAHSSR
jgi:dihydropteroate synthase